MDTHDDAGVFGHVLSIPWGSFDPERLDAEVRAVADPYIVDNFLRKVYHPLVWDYVTVSEVIVGSIRTPLADLRFAWASAETRATLEHQFTQAEAAPQPAWREYTRLVRNGMSEDEIVEAFFKARYGAGPKDLADDDKAIREALKAAP